MTPIYPRTKK